MTQTLERAGAASVAATREPRRIAPPARERQFRPDVEGLRAVAVLLVVTYHAGLGVPAGFVGVDVFFVISGFLITRQLVESVGARGVWALPHFYLRRIRRLLPASTVVVLATVVAARAWAPPLQQRPIALDGIFTTFYGLNYRLAVNGTQYLHAQDAVSPLQHFWSLGVEEQFYAGWPVLIVVAAVIGRRHLRPVLALLLLAVTAVSFAFSVSVTRTLASWAYFSLHTRGWELAIGALIAVGAPRFARLPGRFGDALGIVGLIAVLGAAFGYDATTPYPGSAAALPVLGTAAVIAAGCGRRRRVERVLGEPALQSIGRVSYSWYLWHWPMLVLAPMVIGHRLDWVERIGVVWLSLAAAVVTYFAVEERFRHVRTAPWRGFAFGFALSAGVVTCAAVVIGTLPNLVGSGASVQLARADTASTAVTARMHRDVAAGVELVAAPRNLTPSPAAAATDRPIADRTDCHADFRTIHQGACVWGDPAGAHTAVLLGDSHADAWLPAFDRAGRAAHWRVVDWTKSACPAARLTVVNSELHRTYTECDAWRVDVLSRIAALRPDVVVVSDAENVVGPAVSPALFSAATLATMRDIRTRSGARVVLLADVPVPNFDQPSCVAAHLADVRACTFPVAKAYSFPARHRQLSGDAQRAGYPVVDPRPWICTATTCPAVVGNLLVYRDQTHLTAAFSSWLAPLAATLLRG